MSMAPADNGPASTQYQLAPASRNNELALVSVPAVTETSSLAVPDANQKPSAGYRVAETMRASLARRRSELTVMARAAPEHSPMTAPATPEHSLTTAPASSNHSPAAAPALSRYPTVRGRAQHDDIRSYPSRSCSAGSWDPWAA